MIPQTSQHALLQQHALSQHVCCTRQARGPLAGSLSSPLDIARSPSSEITRSPSSAARALRGRATHNRSNKQSADPSHKQSADPSHRHWCAALRVWLRASGNNKGAPPSCNLRRHWLKALSVEVLTLQRGRPDTRAQMAPAVKSTSNKTAPN